LLCNHGRGTVKTWGHDNDPLAGNTSVGQLTPATISGIQNCKQVVVGLLDGCARAKDGTVYVFGNTTAPKKVPNLTGVTQINEKYTHNNALCSTYAILEDGSVEAWGDNSTNQLGVLFQ
jgi:alpha-tubulin suppressor-like RCC1 family protein